MKKSLVLAMAMALGVTASAYAANPFSDVPAGHWAYDSIDKLAAAGVIDGMGDGTYQGDKTMTRYEMAQIVAKAMAKGANVDKLAAEFADELDNLGVRVAKLEKKADNVTITGSMKARMWNYHASAVDGSNHLYTLRSDLNITGQINEDWQYHAKIRNDQQLCEADSNGNDTAGKGEETTKFMDAYVTGRIGGINVIAGRYNDFLEDGDVLDDRGDMIIASYGKKVKLTAGFGQYDATATKGSKMGYGRVDTKIGVVDAHAAYYRFNQLGNVGGNATTEIVAAGIALPVAKNMNLAATYLRSTEDQYGNTALKMDQDGYTAELSYKGADMAKPGSFGISAKYYDLPAGVVVAHTMDGFYGDAKEDGGFKGFKVGADYVLAKNIKAEVAFYGLEGKENGKHYDTLYSMLTFAF